MATKRGRKGAAITPATLEDVVRELVALKRLVAKYMIYHGVRQADVAKALRTQQGHVSTLVGGAGERRLEYQKREPEATKRK